MSPFAIRRRFSLFANLEESALRLWDPSCLGLLKSKT